MKFRHFKVFLIRANNTLQIIRLCGNSRQIKRLLSQTATICISQKTTEVLRDFNLSQVISFSMTFVLQNLNCK